MLPFRQATEKLSTLNFVVPLNTVLNDTEVSASRSRRFVMVSTIAVSMLFREEGCNSFVQSAVGYHWKEGVRMSAVGWLDAEYVLKRRAMVKNHLLRVQKEKTAAPCQWKLNWLIDSIHKMECKRKTGRVKVCSLCRSTAGYRCIHHSRSTTALDTSERWTLRSPICVLRNFLLTVKASATSLVLSRGWAQYCQMAGNRQS